MSFFDQVDRIDYYFEKIFESIHASHSPEYGRLHVQLFTEAVARFKSKLAERGVAGAYDNVEYHLGLVSYPLGELDLYFADPGKVATERARCIHLRPVHAGRVPDSSEDGG